MHTMNFNVTSYNINQTQTEMNSLGEEVDISRCRLDYLFYQNVFKHIDAARINS